MRLVLSKLSFAALFVVGRLAFSAPAADSFALRPSDTVVFYGDSITDQRMYTMLTELFTVTRYPTLNVKFIHSGWGGDRVTGGPGGPIDLRLQRDVLAYHPTLMTIMLGMNDGNYKDHKPEDDRVYYAGYRHIVDTVRRALPNLRITVLEPSPYDDVTRPINLQPDGYNAVLQKFSLWIKRYAGKTHLDVADLNTPVVDMLKKAKAEDPATAQKILPDRVHPALAGHLVMAEQLLKAWHARALVSSVTINAATGKAAEIEFAKVSNLKTAPLSWTATEEALPLPFASWLADDKDGSMALAIKSSDVTDALNREPLRVTGLAAGRYKLSIDGTSVGNWTGKELAAGVNLAILDTPMARQATEVRDLTIRRIEVRYQRWRFQLPLENFKLEGLERTLKDMDALEGELAARQYSAAQPQQHSFELVLAK